MEAGKENTKDKRINKLLEMVLKTIQLDFSQQIAISDRGDELDAIAAGLNTMSEELESHIRQLHAHEEEIKQTNHFLNTILENIPNMIFVKDARELRFVRFNKAGEKLLGYSREELIGKNDYDFFPKEQADFFTGKDKDVLTKGELLDIPEEPIKTKNGERWLHTKKIPVYNNDGAALYLVGISEDITERREYDDQLKKSNAQLESVNKELEAFSYSVSHDLRAPLRAVDGYAQMLNEDYADKLDEEGKRIIENIRHNASKMGTLIDELLAFSRMGRKELQKVTIDMNELTEGVLIDLSKSVSHRAEIKTDKLHNVEADYGLLYSVMYNYISNAVKYSSKKKHPCIEVSSKETRSEVVFSVKDNGAGFDMRYIGKLFGVFHRLHAQEEFEGTGVGLAIVQRIINRHGGRVWAEGKVGEGATFYFSLTKT